MGNTDSNKVNKSTNTDRNKVDKSTNTDSDTVEYVYVNKEDKGKEDKGKEDKGKVIIEFQPNVLLLSNPPQWTVYYKNEYDIKWEKIILTYTQLKQFIEMYGMYGMYGIETQDIAELHNMGIDINRNRYTMS